MQTLTGLTGISLFTIVSAMFIFSHPTVRKKAYNYFWCIHQLYVLLYIFSLLHGLARKVSMPMQPILTVFNEYKPTRFRVSISVAYGCNSFQTPTFSG